MTVGDDRGSAVVSALIALSVFTVGSVFWLARDASQTIGRRSDAVEIAFQAARSAAQEVDVAALRGDAPTVRIDPIAATARARRTAQSLFAAGGLRGAVSEVLVVGDRVEVAVEVVAPTAVVEGRAVVVAQRG